MRVIAHDPFLTAADDVDLVDPDTLWRESDVISLHAAAYPVDASHRQRRGAGGDEARLVPRQLRPWQPGRPRRAARRVGSGATWPGPAWMSVSRNRCRPTIRCGVSGAVVATPHIASQTATGCRRLYADAIENAVAVLTGTGGCIVPEQLPGSTSWPLVRSLGQRRRHAGRVAVVAVRPGGRDHGASRVRLRLRRLAARRVPITPIRSDCSRP